MKLQIILGLVVVVCAGLLIRAELKMQALEAKAVIQAMQQDIDAKGKAISDRGVKLAGALDTIETKRKAVKTPVQAMQAIPEVIPGVHPAEINRAQLPDAPSALIADTELKTLYDFGAECQECKLSLTAANADNLDLRSQLADTEKQRDAALKIGKVNFWHRLERATKVTMCAAVGAGVGSLSRGSVGAVAGAAGGAVVCSVF